MSTAPLCSGLKENLLDSVFQIYHSVCCRVHFPPRDIKISPPIQTVKENLKPRDFLCSAEVGCVCHAQSEFSSNFFLLKAYPPAKFFWQFENGTQTRNGATRGFVGSVQRAEGGRYTCTAFNELGNIKTEGGFRGPSFTMQCLFVLFCSSFERVVQARVYN